MALESIVLGPIMPPKNRFVRDLGLPFGRLKKDKKNKLAQIHTNLKKWNIGRPRLQFWWFVDAIWTSFSFNFRDHLNLLNWNECDAKTCLLPFRASHFSIKINNKIMSFQSPYLDIIFFIFYWFFQKMVTLGTTSKSSGRQNPPTLAGVRRCQT